MLAFKQRQPRKKRPRGSRREYTEVEFPQSQERIQIDKWVKEKKARKKLSIDSFQIIHKLGDGTYSEVFLAV